MSRYYCYYHCDQSVISHPLVKQWTISEVAYPYEWRLLYTCIGKVRPCKTVIPTFDSIHAIWKWIIRIGDITKYNSAQNAKDTPKVVFADMLLYNYNSSLTILRDYRERTMVIDIYIGNPVEDFKMDFVSAGIDPFFSLTLKNKKCVIVTKFSPITKNRNSLAFWKRKRYLYFIVALSTRFESIWESGYQKQIH